MNSSQLIYYLQNAKHVTVQLRPIEARLGRDGFPFTYATPSDCMMIVTVLAQVEGTTLHAVDYRAAVEITEGHYLHCIRTYEAADYLRYIKNPSY